MSIEKLYFKPFTLFVILHIYVLAQQDIPVLIYRNGRKKYRNIVFFPTSLCLRCATGLKEHWLQRTKKRSLDTTNSSAEMERNMNNMNQRSGNCSHECKPNIDMSMNDRRCRNNMNNNSCGRNNSSIPPMPAPSASCGCNSCNCVDNASSIKNDPLRGMPVGIGYVPWQQWECVYNVDEGLSKGTIFPSLDLPFYGCIPRGYHCSKGGR